MSLQCTPNTEVAEWGVEGWRVLGSSEKVPCHSELHSETLSLKKPKEKEKKRKKKMFKRCVVRTYET